MKSRQTRFSKKNGQAARGRLAARSALPRPRLTPELKEVFRRIGVPPRRPFQPDPFQSEALRALETADVLVTAPTGSGKTWIAQEAIRGYLEDHERCWYASPLKALSNSKFTEFSGIFGFERVGILTGDRKENPDAPLIVGTTEILRNQLYDAMKEGVDIPLDLVILDEAHYLNDPDRGVVWEEVLIYLPQRVRLLLLSATIGNSEEIQAWLEEIRRVRCRVVRCEKRPVPLHFLFLFPDGEMCPLANRRGVLPKIRRLFETRNTRGRRASRVHLGFGWVIDQLRRWDLLPAIFFLKSRADCDQAIRLEVPRALRERPGDDAFRRDLGQLLSRYPFLGSHRQLPYLERFRVGSHHGGQLPHWKLLIEEMMNRGHLDAIYSTSTVAAGVNFPARTVVLIQSDRFDGRRFSNLTATELHQMTGRAGRRGKDRIGFALVLPGLYQDPLLVQELIDSPPEPLRSQIQISFSMVLNLLLSHRPTEIRALLDRSLATFQERRLHPEIESEWGRLRPKLRKLLPETSLPEGDPVSLLQVIQSQRDLRERVQTLQSKTDQEQREFLFSQYFKRGRLFVHEMGEIYVAFHIFHRGKRQYCSAFRLTRPFRIKRRQIRLRKIPAQRIDHLLDYRADIPEDVSVETLSSILGTIPVAEIHPLGVGAETTRATEELQAAEAELAGLPDLQELRARMTSSKLGRTLWADLERLAMKTEEHRHHFWNEFKRCLTFLKETGFVDQEDRLTRDGLWASCLRLDQPLLIAEAIRRGVFDGADPPTLASLIAPFVVDKSREIEVIGMGRIVLEELRERHSHMVSAVESMQRLKQTRGFETAQIEFWPAASLFFWARGGAWDELLRLVPIDEGDMALLILRTADHLRQLFDLKETHPHLADRAHRALSLIIREPVWMA